MTSRDAAGLQGPLGINPGNLWTVCACVSKPHSRGAQAARAGPAPAQRGIHHDRHRRVRTKGGGPVPHPGGMTGCSAVGGGGGGTARQVASLTRLHGRLHGKTCSTYGRKPNPLSTHALCQLDAPLTKPPTPAGVLPIQPLLSHIHYAHILTYTHLHPRVLRPPPRSAAPTPGVAQHQCPDHHALQGGARHHPPRLPGAAAARPGGARGANQ